MGVDVDVTVHCLPLCNSFIPDQDVDGEPHYTPLQQLEADVVLPNAGAAAAAAPAVPTPVLHLLLLPLVVRRILL